LAGDDVTGRVRGTLVSCMSQKRTITVRGATALGIGSMVGAGIFALMGEAAVIAPGALWIFLSFLVVAFVAEGLLQRLTGRRILASKNKGAESQH